MSCATHTKSSANHRRRSFGSRSPPVFVTVLFIRSPAFFHSGLGYRVVISHHRVLPLNLWVEFRVEISPYHRVPAAERTTIGPRREATRARNLLPMPRSGAASRSRVDPLPRAQIAAPPAIQTNWLTTGHGKAIS